MTQRFVIVGASLTGGTAAATLRREGFDGELTLIGSEGHPPYERPPLSKSFLRGETPFAEALVRPAEFYAENGIDLRLNMKVTGIDVQGRKVQLADGSTVAYDRLLLATGAEPVRLTIPGADQPHVHTLRSLGDCKAIIDNAQVARRAVVMGASFIGLEVAASLRARGLEVHVVAPDKRPMERVLGPQMGDFIRALHEEHGVVFHLEDMATAIDGKHVTLKSGGTLEADLVVAGIGVRPRIAPAEAAGLAVDRGVTVNAYLQTSEPTIFAAGDIARWPDPYLGEMIRVEHWVVAERQGQTAALNMLGYREKFDAVPFFWSQYYDVSINYVGHAEQWDELAIEGDIAGRDCLVRFKQNGRTLAVVTIFRDVESLEAELAMEREAAL